MIIRRSNYVACLIDQSAGKGLAANGKRHFKNDAERVVFLFALHQQYTSLLPATETISKNGARKLGKFVGL